MSVIINQILCKFNQTNKIFTIKNIECNYNHNNLKNYQGFVRKLYNNKINPKILIIIIVIDVKCKNLLTFVITVCIINNFVETVQVLEEKRSKTNLNV